MNNMEKADIKIGELFWIYDSGNRHYTHDDGTESQGPIYEKSFRRVEVIGETSRSWCIANKGSTQELFKVPKKDPFGFKKVEYGCYHQIMDDQMKEDNIWDNYNGYKIRQLVTTCSGAALRKIAEIVNYKEEA